MAAILSFQMQFKSSQCNLFFLYFFQEQPKATVVLFHVTLKDSVHIITSSALCQGGPLPLFGAATALRKIYLKALEQRNVCLHGERLGAVLQ